MFALSDNSQNNVQHFISTVNTDTLLKEEEEACIFSSNLCRLKGSFPETKYILTVIIIEVLTKQVNN